MKKYNHFSFSGVQEPKVESVNQKHGSKAVEITGLPGSGKTTLMNREFSGKSVLLAAMPASYGTVKRVLFSLVLSFYALGTRSISLKQTWWLAKKAARLDGTLFSRLNAFRNSVTKFGYHFFKSDANPILIDEGISHIPFILELKNEDIDDFLRRFYQHLAEIKIIFVGPPQDRNTLCERIEKRGHPRAKGVVSVREFVGRNWRVDSYYERALLDAKLDVIFIST